MTALPVACRVSPRAEDAPRPASDIWYQAGAWKVTAEGLRGPDQIIPAVALGLKEKDGLLSWPLRIAAQSNANLSDFLGIFGVALALHGFGRAVSDEIVRATAARAFSIRNALVHKPMQKPAAPKVAPKIKCPTSRVPAAPPSSWIKLDNGGMSNGAVTIAADRLADPAVLAEVISAEPMGLESFLALWTPPDGAAAVIKAARKEVRVWHYETFGKKMKQREAPMR